MVAIQPQIVRVFREVPLQDNGGCDCPIFPLLTRIELLLVDSALSARRTLHLCDTIKRRMELGVPSEVLDWHTLRLAALQFVCLVKLWSMSRLPRKSKLSEQRDLCISHGTGARDIF